MAATLSGARGLSARQDVEMGPGHEVAPVPILLQVLQAMTAQVWD